MNTPPNQFKFWKVYAIIDNGSFSLTEPTLISYWHIIRQIDISTKADSWCCTVSRTGQYTFKFAWNVVREIDNPFYLYSIVWIPNVVSKMSLCLLRAIHNKLLIRDKLTTIGVIDSADCLLCLAANESKYHLFFSCPYSAYLWSLCQLKLNLDPTILSLIEECNVINSKFNGKHKTAFLAKLVLRSATWHIWKERNSRIFQQQSRHNILVFRQLYEEFHII